MRHANNVTIGRKADAYSSTDEEPLLLIDDEPPTWSVEEMSQSWKEADRVVLPDAEILRLDSQPLLSIPKACLLPAQRMRAQRK